MKPILWSLSLALGLLTFGAGCLQETARVPEQAATSVAPASDTNSLQGPTTAPGEEVVAAAEDSEIEDAPVEPAGGGSPLPPSIRPNSPVSEVVLLAQSGLDESVMLAYVTNSPGTFGLTADQIIYLNDIGVPGEVVTAMIQRDEALKEFSAAAASQQAAATQPLQTPGPGMIPEPAPVPMEAGPPPEYATEPSPIPAEELVPTEEPVPTSYFYDSLAPYGNWVTVAGYGSCWRPTACAVNPLWRPYYNCGRWVYTDCGWYWLSDYSWGWAPFHYGRWFHHQSMGWCWMPGHTWGPSWVCWRYSNSHCAWAPLPPSAHYSHDKGLTWHGKPAGSDFHYGLGQSAWAIVPTRHFTDHHLPHFAVPATDAATIFAKTTTFTRIVAGQNHTVVNRGIPMEQVAAATRSAVRQVTLRDRSAPLDNATRVEHIAGDGNSLAVYRPNPLRPAGAHKAIPTRPTALAETTPVVNHSASGNASPSISPQMPARPHGPAMPVPVVRGTEGAADARGNQVVAANRIPPNSLVVIGKKEKQVPRQPVLNAPASQPQRIQSVRADSTLDTMPHTAVQPHQPQRVAENQYEQQPLFHSDVPKSQPARSYQWTMPTRNAPEQPPSRPIQQQQQVVHPPYQPPQQPTYSQPPARPSYQPAPEPVRSVPSTPAPRPAPVQETRPAPAPAPGPMQSQASTPSGRNTR